MFIFTYIADVLGIALNPNGLTHMFDKHGIVYLQSAHSSIAYSFLALIVPWRKYSTTFLQRRQS